MKYCILVRGPKLRNGFLLNKKEEIQSYSLFQKALKSKLIETENEITYFSNYPFFFFFDSYSVNINQLKR